MANEKTTKQIFIENTNIILDNLEDLKKRTIINREINLRTMGEHRKKAIDDILIRLDELFHAELLKKPFDNKNFSINEIVQILRSEK